MFSANFSVARARHTVLTSVYANIMNDISTNVQFEETKIQLA